MTPMNKITTRRAGNRIVHEYRMRTRPDHIFLEIEDELCVFIPLTQGKWTVVSYSSYDIVRDHVWCLHGKYAARRGGDGNLLRMHRAICGTPKGLETDHVNGIKLDNRDRNLRVATTAQNQANKHKDPRNVTGIIGVTPHRGGYLSQIKSNRKNKALGWFPTFEGAAKARLNAEIEVFGEFRPNDNALYHQTFLTDGNEPL